MKKINYKISGLFSRLCAVGFIVAAAVSCDSGSAHEGNITIDFLQKGPDVPASMYGIFFEEINHAGDGGLYAELVMNRGFEDTRIPDGYTVVGDKIYPPQLHNHLHGNTPHEELYFRWYPEEIPGWSINQHAGTGAAISLSTDYPLNNATPTSLQVNIPEEGSKISVTNEGFWGMNFVKESGYDLRFFLRTDDSFSGSVSVTLLSESGKELAGKVIELLPGSGWNEYRLILTPGETDHRGKLSLDFEGTGKLWLDYVSLFPQHTFHGRPNGLRSDVAGILADMKPAFVRWPGGCVVEGITLDNRIRWKETIGDPVTRPGVYDTWGYRTTMGFGYHEFLQFCEDISAEAMFVCNAGIGCQGRVGDACSDDELQYYIDDVLDAIEYALGDENTRWGAVRNANGHASPFPLKYVEIGNENWGAIYAARYDIFYEAIKAKYPDLTLISTLGLGGQNEHEKVDMIDPHWYVAPDMFFLNHDIFDDQPRGDYSIYVGEYACNIGVGGGNILGALGEAAFLSGMERNSDIVHMASYAPLLENVNDRVWPVNLIWLDSYRVMGRSSYYVQKMYAENRPDYNLKTVIEQPSLPVDAKGYVGLGSWDTQAEFRDLTVTTSDGKVENADFRSGWSVRSGEWTAEGDSYFQTGSGPQRWSLWEKEKFDQCTIEFKARKFSGHEGFLLFFGTEYENGFVLNIGGWGNSRTAFERMTNGGLSQLQGEVGQHIENDRWYSFKLVVGEGNFTYYCDGEEMLSVDVSRQRRYAVSGYDEQAGEIVIKVVNAEGKPFKTNIDLRNVAVETKGEIIVLSAKSETDENDLDNPDRIVPVAKQYGGFSSSFEYEFEPWSFNIMRIKVKNPEK